jgi:hypothetical protein
MFIVNRIIVVEQLVDTVSKQLQVPKSLTLPDKPLARLKKVGTEDEVFRFL